MPPDGAERIRLERERQIKEEGYDEKYDDKHPNGKLARAGAAYALFDYNDLARGLWPFHADTFNPKDPLRNLVRAGALIAAEIDRLQRKG